jgi:uncharacterized protein (TIGR00369 family)
MQSEEGGGPGMIAPDESPRSRTFTGDDPRPGAEAARTMSGMEYLRAIQGGVFPPPPMASLMGMELVSVDEGRAVFAVQPAEYHYNPIGVVHGGLASTLLDSAMGCAVHTMLPAGAGYTTLDLTVNLVRPLTHETGRVLCTGSVIHVGGRIATAEGRITDEAGKLYAHGTTTCMIFRSSS